MAGRLIFGRFLLFSLLSVLALAAGRARGDLTIAGYQERLHDPFYVGSDKVFIGAGYNWSGFGRWYDPVATGGNWKQVTMISDNYFITAVHNQPNRGDDPPGAAPKVRFYRTTDPNSEYWESGIALSGSNYQGTRIGSTDLWVGKLANTPPSWVMRYPLAKRHEATNYLSYTDNDLFIFGQDSPRSATSVRVGRNEISLVNSSGNYDWTYDPVGGLGADEAQTESGDSGGPSFFTSGRVPVLAGIHTRTNYDTGISANLDKIIAAVGEPISVSTGLLGDLNGNFRVDSDDFGTLLSNFGRKYDVSYSQGDANGNGTIDGDDFIALLQQYGKSLFAPADFDRDGDVDGDDLATIGSHWFQRVAQPFTLGDADGDSIVSISDLQIFDQNQFRAYFGPLPAPLSPMKGDLTANGIVDEIDLNIVTAHLNQQVTPGTNGDLNGNGVVDASDLAVVTAALGTSFGDLNNNHTIGTDDFMVLAWNWNRSVKGGRLSGDLNGDGIVNALDAKALFGWWDLNAGTFPGRSIPEPATALLVLWAAGLAACRFRPIRPKPWK
jgi:Dockerin type I domain